MLLIFIQVCSRQTTPTCWQSHYYVVYCKIERFSHLILSPALSMIFSRKRYVLILVSLKALKKVRIIKSGSKFPNGCTLDVLEDAEDFKINIFSSFCNQVH